MSNLFRANKKGAPSINVQSTKIVTAGTSQETFTPDTGYDAMEKVVVNPTPFQTKSVTATTSVQTVSPDSGKFLSQVTVNPQIHSQTMYYSSNGTKDLGENNNVRYVNINVPTSSGYNYGWDSETTLWTNSNPTSGSGFPNQTVSLNFSMANYNYIKIYGHISNAESTEIYTIVKLSDFISTGSTAHSTSVALGARSSGGVSITRTVWYVSSTEVGFSAGFSASGVIPQACIPTKITGLR